MNSNVPTKKTYTIADRKKIQDSIGTIKKKKNLIKIFKLILDKNKKYSRNDNGIFINLLDVDDETLYEIELLLYNINKKKLANIESSTDTKSETEKYRYTPYSNDEFTEYNQKGVKLSNQEKNILKKYRYMSETISEQEENIIYKDYDPQTMSESSEKQNSSKK